MLIKTASASKCIYGRLTKGDDILRSLTAILKTHSISSGLISAIGAVSQAKIGYFNQESKQYEEHLIDEPMEVLSLLGNVSIKNNEAFAHLHITLAKRDLSTIGGHLCEGTTVYALEFSIIELTGQAFVRQFDRQTGLFLFGLDTA